MTRKRKLLNAVMIIALILVLAGIYLFGGGGISTPVNAQSAPEPSATENAIHFGLFRNSRGKSPLFVIQCFGSYLWPRKQEIRTEALNDK